MSVKPAPFFLPVDGARLFCLAFCPDKHAGLSTGVVIVPPFAEEMNRSRRQLFLIAQALAQSGVSVVMPDLFGTGDSDGDLAEADLWCWQRNIVSCAEWLVADRKVKRLMLVGLRFGALLAATSIDQLPLPAARLLLLQPVLNGEQFMTQFLRLRLAADMLAPSEQKLTVADLRAQLQTGSILEVAGYPLTQTLVSAIDGLKLPALLDQRSPEVLWFEVAQADALLPASSRAIDKLEAVRVQTKVLAGEPFWSTQEITTVPALADVVRDAVVA